MSIFDNRHFFDPCCCYDNRPLNQGAGCSSARVPLTFPLKTMEQVVENMPRDFNLLRISDRDQVPPPIGPRNNPFNERRSQSAPPRDGEHRALPVPPVPLNIVPPEPNIRDDEPRPSACPTGACRSNEVHEHACPFGGCQITAINTLFDSKFAETLDGWVDQQRELFTLIYSVVKPKFNHSARETIPAEHFEFICPHSSLAMKYVLSRHPSHPDMSALYAADMVACNQYRHAPVDLACSLYDAIGKLRVHNEVCLLVLHGKPYPELTELSGHAAVIWWNGEEALILDRFGIIPIPYNRDRCYAIEHDVNSPLYLKRWRISTYKQVGASRDNVGYGFGLYDAFENWG